MMNTSRWAAALLAAFAALPGCGDQEIAKPEAARSVKLTLVAADSQTSATLNGVARQADQGALAFESDGRLAEVLVDVGDAVTRGQVIATMETSGATLLREKARAEVVAAESGLRERTSFLRQQQAMFDDGESSATQLASAQASVEQGKSELRAAEIALTEAERAMSKARLRAPFAGTVVSRLAHAHSIVKAGQVVLELEGRGRPQIVAWVPAHLTKRVLIGTVYSARRDAGKFGDVLVRLTGVSSRLEPGAVAQAVFDVVSSDQPVASGEGIQVSIPSGDEPQLTLPISALVPSKSREHAEVFLYSPRLGTVNVHRVSLGEVVGDRVIISSGLTDGDRVVTAGVALLRDGQAVVPFVSKHRLTSANNP
jgi:RND family efflux transporter MFP subunit